MAKKKRSTQAETAASDDNIDEIYDEVDVFHQDRDNEILGDFNIGKKKQRVESEVLGVVASQSDLTDDEDYDSDESDDSVDERLSRKKTEIDKSGIKSADAWGNKKLAYYGSHADKDYGGWDENEAEALELEEEDAVTRQKKLDAGIEAVDFAGLLASDDEEAIIPEKKKKTEDKAANKFETMNKKKQVEFMLKHSGSFDQFVKEYNKRKAQFEELKPMLDGIILCMNDHKLCPFTKQIKAITAAYTQYLQSYLMFFYLKETTPVENFKLIENHPILDDIMKQYPLVKQIDEFIENNYRRLMKVSDRLKTDPSYAGIIANPEPPKKKRQLNEEGTNSGIMEEDIEKVFARMASGKDTKNKKVGVFGPALDDIGGVDDEDKKRKITYEMQKNKGLTVKRKKGTAHSRVKKRSQFKKAVHKHRSQVPEVQREVTKYDGERRGIRASTVRSIKLKA
uniref:Sas10 C-terminal domain-containing protein n=1 Tax=Panagrolaimus superbus TaxID=310955 RepID=A0A914ZAK5_9BILA